MDVYRITDRVTGKCYVGSTIRTAARRFREHFTNATSGGRVSPLYDAMRDRGLSAFEVETLATTTLYEELLELERAAIAENDCLMPNGYNVVRGGRGNYGWRMSATTREKIAAKARGRVAHNKGQSPSAETRAKQSASQRERFARESAEGRVRVAWNTGLRASDDTRRKLSEMRRGRKLSERHRLAFTGLKRSPETCERIRQHKRLWWASLSPSDRVSHIAKMTAKAKARASATPISALHKGGDGWQSCTSSLPSMEG